MANYGKILIVVRLLLLKQHLEANAGKNRIGTGLRHQQDYGLQVYLTFGSIAGTGRLDWFTVLNIF